MWSAAPSPDSGDHFGAVTVNPDGIGPVAGSEPRFLFQMPQKLFGVRQRFPHRRQERAAPAPLGQNQAIDAGLQLLQQILFRAKRKRLRRRQNGKMNLQIAQFMADRLTAISRVQPLYPEKLRFRRIEGEVVVEFTVTPEGTVSDPTIISSKPAGSFDRSALQAVRRWRFKPHRDAQGNPIPVRARQIFSFTLDR